MKCVTLVVAVPASSGMDGAWHWVSCLEKRYDFFSVAIAERSQVHSRERSLMR